MSVVLGLVCTHISLRNKVLSFNWGTENTKTNTRQGQQHGLQKNKQTLHIVFLFVLNHQSTTLLFSVYTLTHTHTKVPTDSSACISFYGSIMISILYSSFPCSMKSSRDFHWNATEMFGDNAITCVFICVCKDESTITPLTDLPFPVNFACVSVPQKYIKCTYWFCSPT